MEGQIFRQILKIKRDREVANLKALGAERLRAVNFRGVLLNDQLFSESNCHNTKLSFFFVD